MASESTSGIWASSSASEATMATITDAGTYVFHCDLVNLANGDEVVIKIYSMSSSGGTARVAYSAYYANIQAAPIKFSIPVPSLYSYKATMQQVAGTNNRSITWIVISI